MRVPGLADSHETQRNGHDDQPRVAEIDRAKLLGIDALGSIVGEDMPTLGVNGTVEAFHNPHCVICRVTNNSYLSGASMRPANRDHTLTGLQEGNHRAFPDDEPSNRLQPRKAVHAHRWEGSVPVVRAPPAPTQP
jgi:hypothetical protein